MTSAIQIKAVAKSLRHTSITYPVMLGSTKHAHAAANTLSQSSFNDMSAIDPRKPSPPRALVRRVRAVGVNPGRPRRLHLRGWP
jgi:hypothetical protein